jgi:Flp pilus assembly protein TadG
MGALRFIGARPLMVRVRDERGQGALEFALITPLFIGIIVAMVQVGAAYRHYETLTHAVNVGARAAATCRFGGDGASAYASAASSLGTVPASTITYSAGCTSGSTVTVSTTLSDSIVIPMLGISIPLSRPVSTSELVE